MSYGIEGAAVFLRQHTAQKQPKRSSLTFSSGLELLSFSEMSAGLVMAVVPLAPAPALRAPVVVIARLSSDGLNSCLCFEDTMALEGRPPSALADSRTSLPRFSRAPPSVAHLRMVWIRWFCLRGFERYS